MKILPKLFISFIFTLILIATPCPIFAASPDPSPTPATSPGSGTTVTSTNPSTNCSGLDCWQLDPEVTFTGRLAARARDLLNASIKNYEWAYLKPPPNLDPQPAEKNPFNAVWITFRNIVYAILSLFILAGAFLLIITRGQSITVKKFVPRFILILILVTLSFSLIKFLYDVMDILQGFFIKNPQGEIISTKDLLHVSFKYQDFFGYRYIASGFEESAFMSLLLVKLTSVTYYVMFIILTIRKIILWFFIIVSPIFPLLLFFSPIRNTAKIWIGEFFRWLLYGPLFAIFLGGLVALWQIYIPINTPELPCAKEVNPDNNVYPTSINILLGGPCQKLTQENSTDIEKFNNLNIPDSFMQYVVALLMLWMVIIMPFILLKIFLDYLKDVQVGENGMLPYLLNAVRPKPKPPSPLKKASPTFTPPPPISPLPNLPKSQSAGMAREIERAIDINRSMSHLKPEITSNINIKKSVSQILDLTKVQIPTIRDISKMETSMVSHSATGMEEVNKLTEALKRVSGTSSLMTEKEKEQFINLRQKLKEEAAAGNEVAKSIDEAAKDPSQAKIDEENKLQTVNLEDYEEVKKTWTENYRTLEPPAGPDGQIRSREDWIKDEISQIPRAIDLFMAQDDASQIQAKQMVAKILPFLLLGGFSRAEITAYLKAKLEAAKTVQQELSAAKQDDETAAYVETKHEEKAKTMTLEQNIPEENNQPVQTGNQTIAEGLPIQETPNPEDEVKS